MKAIKIGNYFYLDINHENGCPIMFEEKINRVFKLLNKNEINIKLIPEDVYVTEKSVIWNEEDITKYYTTDEFIYIRFYVDNKEYTINSDTYQYLDNIYELQKNSYDILIW